MVRTECAVPVRELHAEISNEAGDGSRGEIWGEEKEEEVSFVGIVGQKGAIHEGCEEEWLGWVVVAVGDGISCILGRADEDSEAMEHCLVIWENSSWREVRWSEVSHATDGNKTKIA